MSTVLHKRPKGISTPSVGRHLAANIILMLYKPLPVKVKKVDSGGEVCDHSYSYVTTLEGMGPRFEHKPSEARLEDSMEEAEKGWCNPQ